VAKARIGEAIFPVYRKRRDQDDSAISTQRIPSYGRACIVRVVIEYRPRCAAAVARSRIISAVFLRYKYVASDACFYIDLGRRKKYRVYKRVMTVVL
jgi:hypothetical protein